MNNGLPDKSVQLIIADPPYFETKGEFDFVWNTFEEYLKDVEKQANECKRLLAEEDGQLEISIDRIGDWGESTPIKSKYVQDGFLVDDNEFSLIKTITY